MRINNPKSLAGYTRGLTNNDENYSLVTLQQLETAIKSMNDKFINLLKGNTNAGLNGITSNCGYAWLTADGKVSPNLLPALAITNTYVIDQNVIGSDLSVNELFKNANLPVDDPIVRIEWWKNHVAGDEYADMQKGDIVIVVPGKDVCRENINSNWCGSYIVINKEFVDEEEDNEYHFAKIAYEDGKIVSINGKVPNNTAGVLTLSLADILAHDIPFDESNIVPSGLSRDVYRISSTSGLANDKRRFSFDGNEYTLLSEFTSSINDECAARIATDEFISGAVDTISGIIGKNTLSGSYNTSDSIYPQLRQLRYDIDANAILTDAVISGTNFSINRLTNQIEDIKTRLNEDIVELTEKTIELEATSIYKFPNIGSFNSVSGEIPFTSIPTSGCAWVYKFYPDKETYKDQRIVAIYDNKNNQVNADISFVENGTDIYWEVRVDLALIIEDGINKNVITAPWKMLVASTIKFDYASGHETLGVTDVRAGYTTAKTPQS